MKKLTLALAVIAPLSAWAQSKDICSYEKKIASEAAALDFTPQWFFKPMPKKDANDDREEVSVIGMEGNVMVDMKTGQYSRVPGGVDGVASPDGEMLVVPSMSGLAFYDRDDVTKKPRLLFDDDQSGNTLNGVYHSIGVVKNEGNKRTYRAITDNLSEGDGQLTSLYYKDFTTEMTADGPKFAKNSNPPELLCGNLTDKYFKLPMLSKDGKMLSAYDVESGTTKIWSIKRRNGRSECDLKKDLGFATGKAEFSPDGKSLTFAMDTHPTNPDEVQWFPTPPQSKNYNVYVVNMEEDTVTRISNQNSGNAYYPSFWYDGSVVYMAQEPNPGAVPNPKYSVVRTKIEDGSKMDLVDFSAVNNCSGVSKEFVSSMALGLLWSEVCENMGGERSLSALAFKPLSLDPGVCQELVKKFWNDKKSKGLDPNSIARIGMDQQSDQKSDVAMKYYQNFLQLSEEDLLSACPKTASRGNGPNVVNTNQQGGSELEGDNPLGVCMQCHNASSDQPIPLDNMQKLSPWKTKIFQHVANGFMPKGVVMEKDQRDRLLKWIMKNVPGEVNVQDNTEY